MSTLTICRNEAYWTYWPFVPQAHPPTHNWLETSPSTYRNINLQHIPYRTPCHGNISKHELNFVYKNQDNWIGERKVCYHFEPCINTCNTRDRHVWENHAYNQHTQSSSQLPNPNFYNSQKRQWILSEIVAAYPSTWKSISCAALPRYFKRKNRCKVRTMNA